MTNAHEEATKEIEQLRELAAVMYQFAGNHNAPVEWLDALDSAAHGKPFTCEGLLPYVPKEKN